MGRYRQLGLVILLLLSVTYVFISPAVDLEPSALRAMRFVTLLFTALVLAHARITLHLQPSFHRLPLEDSGDRVNPSFDRIDRHCARLC